MIILETAGISNVGLRRSNNEDAYIVMPEQRVVAVADGMGGAAAGEIASGIFVAAVSECFAAGTSVSEEDAYTRIQLVFSMANKRIIENVTQLPENAGMGCTAELLAFADGRYIIGHVGDSRIYLLRNRELRQLTRDHSLVQMQLDNGMITAEEARVHPKKNIVLRAVGMEHDFSLDIMRGNSSVDDLFLLCSDGLSDMIDDPTIFDCLSTADTLQQKAQKLIDSALSAGGKDNVTVVLCQVRKT